ncbi:amino acid adenylation domain-containing protein [Streptomyces sp. NPDC058534]|uniref:amino acid adenylation domain-containing protein n=1 Tax=Streptomyces sp. NPDC058534 TaxID=3346541 RepID=UPI0036530FA3
MRTIWDVVTEQCERTPTAVAAVGTRRYTYEDFTERALTLSKTALDGVPRGSLIALDTSNPVSASIAMLAAARCGCAALPLNSESPSAHREKVFSDARPALVLKSVEEGLFTAEATAHGQDGEAAPGPFSEIAYVMYTSGSTGQPKGVMVPHKALLARLSGLAEVPGFAPGESIVAMTALSFDISMAELLLPLSVGGTFIAAPTDARTDPDTFAEFVGLHTPDIIQATPSFWRLASAGGWEGAADSRIWCGGEPLTQSLAAQLLGCAQELWNLYGPTEATIFATAARIESADSIPLGSPLPGSGVALDGPTTDGGEPEEGEILLFGEGLAAGYLGQEELTRRRFHLHDTPQGRQMVYRTGDRGRRLPDGRLFFLGRDDDQVKLRGHRIELGEVEATLEEHPAVTETVVVLRDRDRPERAYLEALIVTGVEVTPADLRQWIRDRLPASHCPAKFTVLDSLPRTTAGKVDRARLSS